MFKDIPDIIQNILILKIMCFVKFTFNWKSLLYLQTYSPIHSNVQYLEPLNYTKTSGWSMTLRKYNSSKPGCPGHPGFGKWQWGYRFQSSTLWKDLWGSKKVPSFREIGASDKPPRQKTQVQVNKTATQLFTVIHYGCFDGQNTVVEAELEGENRIHK